MSSTRGGRDEIERALTGYQAQAVSVLGAAHGLDRAEHPRKSDLVAALAERLADPERLRARIGRLSPAQREALAYVARKAVPVPLRSVMGLLRGQGNPTLVADDQLLELLKYGFLLYAAGAGPWKLDFSSHDPTFQSRPVWTPRSVAALIDGDAGWVPLLHPAPEPARVEAGDTGDLLRDLYLVQRAVRARPLRLTQSGAPHQADLRKMVQEMRPHRDPKAWRAAAEEIDFALLLALAAGLIEEADGALVPGAAGAEFLHATASAQAARLFLAWAALPLSELGTVPTLTLDGYLAPYGDVPGPEQLAAARAVVSSALGEMADGCWWSLASLTEAIRRREPDFLISNDPPPFGYYFGGGGMSFFPGQSPDQYRGIRRAGVEYKDSLLKRDADWDAVEGAYVRQVLREPLRWLGLVDVGLDAAGAPVAVRLTPLGRTVLKGTPPAPAPSRGGGPRLVVQPNFEVIVLDASASLDLLARLDAFATARSVDRAAIYALTREGIVGALQVGARLAEIERLLIEEGGGPLPQNVQFSLTEWARHFERVTLRHDAALLEADDAAQLDGWLRDPTLRGLLGERLSATVVTVAAGRADALATRLGNTVEAQPAGAPPPGALKVQTDGGLLLRPEWATRFERHRLQSFADEAGDGRRGLTYRLTAASLGRGRAAGWTAARLLPFLQGRLGTPPPADLVLSVRGWLGEMPAVQQATVRLVRLPDASAWAVLEAVAAGGGLVGRVGPTLAVVDEPALARLAEALAARGVRLEAALAATVAADLPGPGRAAPAGAGAGLDLAAVGLQTLRGKPLREFVQEAIRGERHIVILHQTGSQKQPKRHRVLPTYVEHRPLGYYLLARVETGGERAFKLDDIFGVALEEGTP